MLALVAHYDLELDNWMRRQLSFMRRGDFHGTTRGVQAT